MLSELQRGKCTVFASASSILLNDIPNCSMFSIFFISLKNHENFDCRRYRSDCFRADYRMDCHRAVVQTGDGYFLGFFWDSYYLLKNQCGLFCMWSGGVRELDDFLSQSNNCLLRSLTTLLPYLGCLPTTSSVGHHRQILLRYEIPRGVLKYLQLGQVLWPQMLGWPRPQMEKI